MYDCNLKCSWCDTPYTWANTPERAAAHRTRVVYDVNEPKLGLKRMTARDVWDTLSHNWNLHHATTVVFSGGEPMMQQGLEMRRLLQQLRPAHQIHFETAGTIAPREAFEVLVDQFNVSPKLHNSGNPVVKRRKLDVLRLLNLTGKARFKFVVTGPEDFDEIRLLADLVGIWPSRIQVMPEGITAVDTIENAKKIADLALKSGYGLSMRTHILLWGDVPGR
jgi:7-carboxy-7-deazaguanine synthase